MVLHCQVYSQIALCTLSVLCICQSYLSIYKVLHPTQAYSIYSFKNELQMVLRESCCRQLLSFLRMLISLFNLLLICSICLSQLKQLSIYTPRYLAVSLDPSIWFSIYIFIVSPALWLLPTLKTMRFDFLTLIINLFAFNQFVILSSEVLISSSNFLQFLFE